jgi:hypothetical protein
LHPDKQATAFAFPASPILNVRSESSPPAKVEIADTKVGMRGGFEGLLECRKQGLVDVIENAGHLKRFL